MKKVNVGVIGVGYLGQFHAEKYAALPDTELIGIVDTDPVRAAEVAEKAGTRWFTEPSHLLEHVDAVSIVVPTAYHYAVALQFLARGVHVLLEKPITATLEQADALIALAARNKLVLQIGHIERFNPAVTSVKALVNAPRFMSAERSAPFTVRCTDVNVVLDLMIHDLDIVSVLADSEPVQVSAAGASVITKEIDTAAARILFQNGCIADVTASRVSEEKKRILRVFDGEKVFTSDYQSQKATVSSRGESSLPELVVAGIPTERRDTLNEEIKSFVHCIQTGTPPPVTGQDGRRALALARLITDNIERGVSGFVRFQEKSRGHSGYSQ